VKEKKALISKESYPAAKIWSEKSARQSNFLQAPKKSSGWEKAQATKRRLKKHDPTGTGGLSKVVSCGWSPGGTGAGGYMTMHSERRTGAWNPTQKRSRQRKGSEERKSWIVYRFKKGGGFVKRITRLQGRGHSTRGGGVKRSPFYFWRKKQFKGTVAGPQKGIYFELLYQTTIEAKAAARKGRGTIRSMRKVARAPPLWTLLSETGRGNVKASNAEHFSTHGKKGAKDAAELKKVSKFTAGEAPVSRGAKKTSLKNRPAAEPEPVRAG